MAIRYLLLSSLLLSSFASAETSMWRVSKGSNQLYIGGTIHLLSQADYPLPDEFEQAFQATDELVLETDLDALSTPKTQTQLMQRLLYTDGSTLKDKLKPQTYKALERYCKTAGLAIGAMQKMKPSLVVLTLTMVKLKKLGLAGAGVDQFFLQKAKAKGKKITGLETTEDQIKLLEDMGKGQENEFILSTIEELQKITEFTIGMKKAWRSGSLGDLEKLGIKPMLDEFPTLNQSLLVNRNNAWIPKIKAMLITPERELILVGALHLAGEEGVLAQLKKQGYVVEKY